MRVSEIFYSLQGEGVHLGVPAVFIRLAGCNLRCTWCDSTYAWKVNPDTKRMSVDSILEAVRRHDPDHVVLTGGEPLLQKVMLTQLVRKLKAMERYVEVETNGTVSPGAGLLGSGRVDQFNVAVKLGHSRNRAVTEVAGVIEEFVASNKAYFKFVVEDLKNDSMKIAELASRHGIPRGRIILMPRTGMDVRGAERVRRMQALAEICKRQRWRLSPRLHVDLWEGVRGR